MTTNVANFPEQTTVQATDLILGSELNAEAATAAITSGLTTLTASSATFSADHVGNTVIVEGAGAGGADLKTTIASFTSTTVVEVTDAAGTTVSAAVLYLPVTSVFPLSGTWNFGTVLVAGDTTLGDAAGDTVTINAGSIDLNNDTTIDVKGGAGGLTIQTSTDSTTAIQILDSDGGTPVVNVDTANERLGIGKASPSATLHVAGLVYQDGLGLSTYFGFHSGKLDDLATRVNAGFGYSVFAALTTGTNNVGVGGFVGTNVTSGSDNIFIGRNAGSTTTTGSTNIAIGNNVNASAAGADDELNIGNTLYGDLASDNIGIGGNTWGTSATKTLLLTNGTAPTSSPANSVQLYSQDVSASAELKVRDEAGNVTTLSPHSHEGPPELYDEDPGIERVVTTLNYFAGRVEYTNETRRGLMSRETPEQLAARKNAGKDVWFARETFADYNARHGLTEADEGYLRQEFWDDNEDVNVSVRQQQIAAFRAKKRLHDAAELLIKSHDPSYTPQPNLNQEPPAYHRRPRPLWANARPA